LKKFPYKLPLCLLAFLVFCGYISAQETSIDNPAPSKLSDEDAQNQYMALGERMFSLHDFQKSREAFEKVLNTDSRNSRAQYFLGLIEYEEGNIEKAKIRFQIAYECLETQRDAIQLPADAKKVRLEFPDEYKANIYYKDGWYLKPKNKSETSSVSLNAGSDYRIELKSNHKETWINKSIIGIVIAFSFFLVR